MSPSLSNRKPVPRPVTVLRSLRRPGKKADGSSSVTVLMVTTLGSARRAIGAKLAGTKATEGPGSWADGGTAAGWPTLGAGRAGTGSEVDGSGPIETSPFLQATRHSTTATTAVHRRIKAMTRSSYAFFPCSAFD